MAKSSPVKVSVECPHCGFKQQEYAAAKTTMCRQCGAHFSPSAPKRAPIVTTRAAAPAPAPAPPKTSAASLIDRLDGFWKSKRSSVVECFDCKRKQEVSGAATSTICPSCSAHIDLNNYKVASSFSRSIRTHGDVHITAKGDLSSSNVRCRNALVEGRVRGNLHCDELVRIDVIGKIPGRIGAREVRIEKRAEVQFFRRVRVGNIEIRGRMIGEIIAHGTVTVRKHGVLEGSVTARGINVEKGGVFSGQLIIGKGDLQQGELLPADAVEANEKDPAAPLAQPLPAT